MPTWVSNWATGLADRRLSGHAGPQRTSTNPPNTICRRPGPVPGRRSSWGRGERPGGKAGAACEQRIGPTGGEEAMGIVRRPAGPDADLRLALPCGRRPRSMPVHDSAASPCQDALRGRSMPVHDWEAAGSATPFTSTRDRLMPVHDWVGSPLRGQRRGFRRDRCLSEIGGGSSFGPAPGPIDACPRLVEPAVGLDRVPISPTPRVSAAWSRSRRRNDPADASSPRDASGQAAACRVAVTREGDPEDSFDTPPVASHNRGHGKILSASALASDSR